MNEASNECLLRNWEATRARVREAARQSGRHPNEVGLMAVSKGHPAEKIRVLAHAGQRDFGENYLQEALAKMRALVDLPLTWHFIGQIQTNKTRLIAEHFHWVHTIDRERIAARLSEQRPHYAPPLQVCIQVSLEDEPGKGGVRPEELESLAMRLTELPRLTLRGLMCIPPPRDTFDAQLAPFMRLRSLLEDLNARGLALDTLSMGMSADMAPAVAAGATWVRIGTSIFGERKRNP